MRVKGICDIIYLEKQLNSLSHHRAKTASPQLYEVTDLGSIYNKNPPQRGKHILEDKINKPHNSKINQHTNKTKSNFFFFLTVTFLETQAGD